MIDWKPLGMALILCASSWTGFRAAAAVRRTDRELRQLRLDLERMRCEISCRLTPIGKLSAQLAQSNRGALGTFFSVLAKELHSGEAVEQAAETAFAKAGLSLPPEVMESLRGLFASFGSYDYAGQLRQIELTQTQVAAGIALLAEQKQARCRSYELLGLCTGLCLVILVA